MTENELNEAFEQLCASKAEELRLLGYEHVTGEEVWACVSAKYAKKGQPELYQIVNDILSLRASSFMNYMTMSALKGSSF